MKCDFCGHVGHDESEKACPIRVASVRKFTTKPQPEKTMLAQDILREALATIEARGKTYDPSSAVGERSMPRIIELFQEQTGKILTEAEGWRFMRCVKQARLESTPGHRDSIIDEVAYNALEQEALTRAQQPEPPPAKKRLDLSDIIKKPAAPTMP